MIVAEGRKIVWGSAGVSAIFGIFNFWLDIFILSFFSVISMFFFLFCLYFFRDGNRTPPQGKKWILAPADGKVIFVGDIGEDPDLKTSSKLVSIFMSVLNVHTNRVPVEGTVTRIEKTKGKFLAAFKHSASELNEQTKILIQCGARIIKVKQIAGFIARRIVCNLKSGDEVQAGDRLGFIYFGSRVDVILPSDVRIHIQMQDRVRGGETIIGEFSDE